MRNKLNSCLYAIKSKIYMTYCRISDNLWLEGTRRWVNSNPRIPFVTQESLFVNENPVL